MAKALVNGFDSPRSRRPIYSKGAKVEGNADAKRGEDDLESAFANVKGSGTVDIRDKTDGGKGVSKVAAGRKLSPHDFEKYDDTSAAPTVIYHPVGGEEITSVKKSNRKTSCVERADKVYVNLGVKTPARKTRSEGCDSSSSVKNSIYANVDNEPVSCKVYDKHLYVNVEKENKRYDYDSLESRPYVNISGRSFSQDDYGFSDITRCGSAPEITYADLGLVPSPVLPRKNSDVDSSYTRIDVGATNAIKRTLMHHSLQRGVHTFNVWKSKTKEREKSKKKVGK